jgi:hypothetical protein
MVGATKHIVPHPQTPYEVITKIIGMVESQVIQQPKIQLLDDYPSKGIQDHQLNE